MLAHKFISQIICDTPRKEAISELIRRAEKFYFGEIPGETISENIIRIPLPTIVEREAWDEGLIPLPFPIVFYEFIIDKTRCAVLVIENQEEKTWSVIGLNYFNEEYTTAITNFTVEMRIGLGITTNKEGWLKIKPEPGYTNINDGSEAAPANIAIYLFYYAHQPHH